MPSETITIPCQHWNATGHAHDGRCKLIGRTVSHGVCLRACELGKHPPNVKPAEPKKALPVCVHLGRDTLRRVLCVEGCGKGYHLNEFACHGGYGSCTLKKRGADVRGCCKVGIPGQCPKYVPLTLPEKTVIETAKAVEPQGKTGV